MSKEEEVKESFKGKDMTYDQYQQLKQLNDSHGQGPKEDDTDTQDTAEAAKRRYGILYAWHHILGVADHVVGHRNIFKIIGELHEANEGLVSE